MNGESLTPEPTDRPPDDERLAPVYRSVIAVLTWGFRIGAALLLCGLVVAAIRREPLNESADPFSEVIPTILDGDAAGLVDLAILAMMATPLATVVAVAVGFFRAGDRRYGILSLVVLAILAVSIAQSLLR